MKSRLLRTGIGSIIFLLLIAAVFSVMQPVYNGVNSVLHENEQKLLAVVKEKTGLGISYHSLSPSILTGIHLKGIEVFEDENDKTVLTVQNAVLHYRLFVLLRGDFEHAFTGLTITGVNFTFNKTENAGVVSKIEQLAQGTAPAQKETKSTAFLSPETIESLKQTIFSLPFSIRIRKVTLSYTDEQVAVTAGFRSIKLDKRSDGSSFTENLTGYVCMEVSKETHETAGLSFQIDGRILRDISGSSALCSISEYAKADYTLGKMSFLLRYSNRCLAFRSMLEKNPVNANGSFNIDTGGIDADFKMNSVNPFLIVKMKKIPDGIKQLYGTSVSTHASLSYNVQSMLLSWAGRGMVTLPQRSMFSGEQFSFDLKGDNENITVRSLKAHGVIADAEFSGSYHIPTMQPSGTLSVTNYTLPNGNSLSGDLYFDPLAEGFMCFIPQLFLGDQTLTALQLTVTPQKDSVDFSFDMNDYSHADFEQPGEVKFDGSYSYGEHQFLQASASINSIFLDTAANIISFFLEKESALALRQNASALEPYIFTNEIYISTDFKSVSFNSPYSVIANTKQEKQFLLLSFDGNESSVQISEFNLIYGNQSVRATLEADISEEDKQVLFFSDCMINSIPYHFTGDFRNGKWLGITGDYNLDAQITFGNETQGTVQLTSLPLSINQYILSLSTSLRFTVSKAHGFQLDIDSFDCEEVSGKIAAQPRIALTGKVTNDSFVMTSISYADNISVLGGTGQVLWNVNGGIFDSLSFDMSVQNDITTERLSFIGNCTNPMHVPLTDEHLKNDFYFTADAVINSFPLSRVMGGQLVDDTLSAEISASGTVSNPYVSMNLKGLSMQFNGAPLVAKGNAVVEDGSVDMSNLDMEWSGMKVSNTKAAFDIAAFSGTAAADFELDFGGKTMYAPFTVTAVPLSEKKGSSMPESFAISFDTDSITGSLLNHAVPVHLSFTKVPGKMIIASSDDLGVSGTVLDNGTVSLKVRDDKPIHLTINGSADAQFIHFYCTDISCDLSQLSSLINSPFFAVYSGVLSGSLSITGLGTDPDMDGLFTLSNFECNLPDYIPDHMTAQKVLCTFNQNEITIPQTEFQVKESRLVAAIKVMLDRWTFSSVEATLLTTTNKGIPVDIKVPLVRMKGNVGLDTSLVVADNRLDVAGTITLQDSEITAMTRSGASADYSSSTPSSTTPSAPMDMHIALKLLVDQKVKFVLNPILQGLVAPQTPIEFTMDTTEGTWNLKGDIVLRGGEVTYLNRNFYLKEGRIVLNETQDSFDPNLTIRAETRERDENGEPVTISISAIRQNASRFSPVLTATPAKSESEIYSLLGQIVTADSTNQNGTFSIGNMLIAGLDYSVQVTLLRKGEDALRDLCNFDIFSVRTMMLQNALKQGLNMNQDAANTNSFGNYFDNSTVYIGKYFGSALYADALLQWTYDSSKYEKDNPVSGIVFQPELGFELSSTFANIRWNLAPNLGSFEGSWYDPLVASLVPATSITLSWKLTF